MLKHVKIVLDINDIVVVSSRKTAARLI